jgi:transmembrane sensor
MNESRLDAERDPIYATAAEWLLRLQQPNLSLEETLSWQQWMAQDPHHSQAFHDLEELWKKFGTVPTPEAVSKDALHADAYDGSTPVSGWSARPVTTASRRSVTISLPGPRRMVLAATLLIVLTALMALVAGSLFAPPTVARLSATSTFETAVGQNATVRLPDGSRVQLGGHTRLGVVMKPGLRQIDLSEGEAYFEVAKDRARPFLVRAGTATVTAVGTEFNIRRSDDRVVVSVLEGRVLVQPMTPVVPIAWLPVSRAVGPPAPIAAGQRTTVNRRGVESTEAVGDASSAIAWQDGRLAFEAEPLRYVVQDVNRYAEKPIVVADSRTGDLRVTGTVMEANIIGWVNSLQAAFGLHADIQSDRIVLRQD